ncbi:hypothetical protein EDB98_107113 [Pseudomonas fluorescens]|nr:hypothetical protein EDB98_107113 [Pseudomonas fluorescens]SFW22041.1 hypothetical protein SAMN03159439_00583 [Pseudomonas sp. NFACC04-2]
MRAFCRCVGHIELFAGRSQYSSPGEKSLQCASQLVRRLLGDVMTTVNAGASDFLFCPRRPNRKHIAIEFFQIILQRPNNMERALKLTASLAVFPVMQVVQFDSCAVITEHPDHGFGVVNRGLKVLIIFSPHGLCVSSVPRFWIRENGPFWLVRLGIEKPVPPFGREPCLTSFKRFQDGHAIQNGQLQHP